jgi:uncharacterized membrane protein YphA (DoxX/SURF4 family)
MQNPDRLRYMGRIVGTLAGFGAAMVVMVIFIIVLSPSMVNTTGSAVQREQAFDTYTYIGAFIAFIVLGFVYRRVRKRFERRADEIESQAAGQSADAS